MIDDENQTLFAQDEPMIEAQTTMQAATLVDPVVALKKKKQARLIKVGLGLFALLFVSLMAVAMTMPKRQQETVAEPTATPTTQQAQQQSELDRTLNLLHEDITKADPATNDLPVPPIDFELTLEGNSN